MLTKRLIACFDVVNGRVTKAQQFQDNIDVAPAEDLAQQLYEDQIDEIVFYDIKASAEKRKIDLDTVRAVAEHVFVPFTVGGGVRSVDDMFEVLKAGAEKISIDSMAVRNPDIIRGSRKRRIAAGSGTQVQEVNRLLKQFDQMQRMMKQLKKGGGLQRMLSGMRGRMP